jgi:hypothetical protein
MVPQPSENDVKWYEWIKRKAYGEEGLDTGRNNLPFGLKLYEPNLKKYWDEERAVGVIEFEGKFVGVACLAAKEVTDKENFVRRFGLGFEKDIQWHAISGLLDHLSRSPMFKAVLITTSNIPFKLEPDIPEEMEGKLAWLERNYQFHREKVDALKLELESQKGIFGGPYPSYLPKQIKEEEDHARKFLEAKKSLMQQLEERMKNYFLIKENLFATALFFYVYTDAKESLQEALREIESRKYSLKMEIVKTYFVKCSDVKDPLIVFNSEFFPYVDEAKKYYCLALAQDCVGFSSDKDVAIALKHMFTSALELPTEEPIEEQVHIPSEEVSIPKEKSAFLGYVVSSIVKRKVTKRRVYFPLDVLTGHAIIYGKTRVGKSFLSLILIQEALANGIKVTVFDPHGTLASRLKPDDQLKVVFTGGKAEITGLLEEIYKETSN